LPRVEQERERGRELGGRALDETSLHALRPRETRLRVVSALAPARRIASIPQLALREMAIGEVPKDRDDQRLVITATATEALLDLGAMRVDVLPVEIPHEPARHRRIAQGAQAHEICGLRAPSLRIEFGARRIPVDHPSERARREAELRELDGLAAANRALVSGIEFGRVFRRETDALAAGFSENSNTR